MGGIGAGSGDKDTCERWSCLETTATLLLPSSLAPLTLMSMSRRCYTPPSSSATLSSSQASARRSPGLPSAPSAPSLTPAPLTQSNLAANCKYTDSNVGSPQDLSTTSSGGTPQPGAGPKSPDSDIEDNGPTSPLSPSPGAGASSSATATSTKKESDTKSSPPQIYPWMKRVHLGQSKCHFLFDPSPDLD